jgi:UDP-2,3-diacylglucosamine pyrophosphatase LpxH
VNYISEFERTLADEARRHAVDGVICGHIHHAAIHDDFGVRYVNCGDWVESCSVIVEHFDGRLKVVSWTDEMCRMRPSASPVVRGEGRGAEIAA